MTAQIHNKASQIIRPGRADWGGDLPGHPSRLLRNAEISLDMLSSCTNHTISKDDVQEKEVKEAKLLQSAMRTPGFRKSKRAPENTTNATTDTSASETPEPTEPDGHTTTENTSSNVSGFMAASSMGVENTPRGPNFGNHALQDYQMQLMLLEQQNKKRLLMARQEQDSMSSHPGIVPGTNGRYAPNFPPQGSRKISKGHVQGRVLPSRDFDPSQVMPPNMLHQMLMVSNGQNMPRSHSQYADIQHQPTQGQLAMSGRVKMMPTSTSPGSGWSTPDSFGRHQPISNGSLSRNTLLTPPHMVHRGDPLANRQTGTLASPILPKIGTRYTSRSNKSCHDSSTYSDSSMLPMIGSSTATHRRMSRAMREVQEVRDPQEPDISEAHDALPQPHELWQGRSQANQNREISYRTRRKMDMSLRTRSPGRQSDESNQGENASATFAVPDPRRMSGETLVPLWEQGVVGPVDDHLSIKPMGGRLQQSHKRPPQGSGSSRMLKSGTSFDSFDMGSSQVDAVETDFALALRPKRRRKMKSSSGSSAFS